MNPRIHQTNGVRFANFSFFILAVTLLLTSSFSSPALSQLLPDVNQDQSIVANAGSDSIFCATVFLNGVKIDRQIAYVQRGEKILVDAGALCDIAGGHCYPFVNNTGLTVQYGKIISFAIAHYNQGFVACNMVDMLPPAEAVNNVVMAPLSFLALAINGAANFNQNDSSLNITTSTPSKIGDIISEARGLADALTAQNFIVQQGAINKVDLLELFYAGYTPDCQGNNVGTPYFMVQTPPAPGMSFVYGYPGVFVMRPDEAFVFIGKTPPECAYFSYCTYLQSRYYEDPSPNRKKILASMGNPINAYNIPEGRLNPQAFNRLILIISTADKNMEAAIRQAAIQAGIAADDIFVDICPSEIARLGLDSKADFFTYTHRTSLFANPNEQNQYVNNPPLEILRITPATLTTPDFFPTPELRQRGSGTTEFYLNDGFEQLRQAIITKYSDGFNVIPLTTTVWGLEWQLEGREAIKQGVNTLGEIRDTIYLLNPTAEPFEFNQSDIVVVFGVDHTKTNKAVYCNVNIYGNAYQNGVGGVMDRLYKKTAREFLADSILADNFYVWKFARTAIDEHTTVIPPDSNKDYTGLDYGANANVGFRAYVEPATKVGPAPAEIIWDQIILLRPKNVGTETKSTAPKNFDLGLSAYPNPYNSQIEIQLKIPDLSDVQVCIFNIQGQMVKELFSASSFSGSKNIIWTSMDSYDQPVSSGVYLIKVIYKDHKSQKQNVRCCKVSLIR